MNKVWDLNVQRNVSVLTGHAGEGKTNMNELKT